MMPACDELGITEMKSVVRVSKERYELMKKSPSQRTNVCGRLNLWFLLVYWKIHLQNLHSFLVLDFEQLQDFQVGPISRENKT